MKTIYLCKFEPLHDKEPEPVTIIINSKLPTFESFADCTALQQSNDFFEKEARVLIDALYNSLPQGTFDRLGIEFMKKKVSLYRGKTGG